MAELVEPLVIEGGLLSPDLVERIEQQEGQRTVRDLREPIRGLISKGKGERRAWRVLEELPDRFSIVDYASHLWRLAREEYRQFRDLGRWDTSSTRERWVNRLLRLLDYNPHFLRSGINLDGKVYPISHRCDPHPDSPPLHIVAWDQELGEQPTVGRGQKSPHSLVQEYLNNSEDVWGIVTNGRRFRILRTSGYFTRPSYIQFDLEQIFENELFDAFVLFVRLAHRSRLPLPGQEPAECLLEKYFLTSKDEGDRARDRLRDSVKNVLEVLGRALIKHPANQGLRDRLREGTYSERDFYRELLYLIYRIVFLFCADERGLLRASDPSSNGQMTRASRLYSENLSASRLRRLAEAVELEAQEHYDDLWLGLQTLFRILGDADLARRFCLSPLNGELFSCDLVIDSCRVSNSNLLEAVRHLSQFVPDDERVPRRINYARMDVEELGSVYESLLDYQPAVDLQKPEPFWLEPGTERKSTGSYYTPDELVRELVRTALEPVLEERLKRAGWSGGEGDREAARRAILSIRVIDPACGSGHFLLAAARRLGQELARVETGQQEPDAEQVRRAVREVIRHCIYGVDKNPLAVDLCRVALWIEGHCRGTPLTFLDHHIKCGDSLVGVFRLADLRAGIPDGAYKVVEFDDKDTAKWLRKKNRDERKAGHQDLLATATHVVLPKQEHERLEEQADDSPAEVESKRATYERLQAAKRQYRLACDLWTAAFLAELQPGVPVPTTDAVRAALRGGQVDPQVARHAQSIARRFRFFHWELEFPHIFEQGGFDVVLCNPPWERVKLEEKPFFSALATRFPSAAEIAAKGNAAQRRSAIKREIRRGTELGRLYRRAKHDADAVSRFLRESGRFPLTGSGDINTYSVFSELFTGIVCPQGRAGAVVPTGIASDHSNRHFFADLVDKGRLDSLFDFENRRGLFPGIHRSYRFCLLTLVGAPEAERDRVPGGSARSFRCAFMLTAPDQLRDPARQMTLHPDDIALLNPNTRTLPIFRTRQDAELTRYIYRRVPVLVDETAGLNPWGVSFLRMFDMAVDSGLFRTAEQLEADGYRLVGNVYVKGRGRDRYLPLYEAKMIWLLDHRYSSYEGLQGRSRSGHLPSLTEEQRADAAIVAVPWYWVHPSDLARRAGSEARWYIVFRDIVRATDERTAVFAVVPPVAVGNKAPVLWLHGSSPVQLCGCACAVSVVLDYVVRNKLAGTTLNFFYVRQLPVLPPAAYGRGDLCFIVPRALECTYTAWDLKPMADDVWRDAQRSYPDVCKAIYDQWQDNKNETGGHRWEPPDWVWVYPEIETDRSKGIPLPPFKWKGDRRARIMAELDAYFALLYGLSRKQLRFILDPADLTEKELEDILDPYEEVDDPLDEDGYRRRCEASRFPGETFRVLKEKELREYGEYRTRRLVLEAYERLKDRFAGRRTEYRHLVRPRTEEPEETRDGDASRAASPTPKVLASGQALGFDGQDEQSGLFSGHVAEVPDAGGALAPRPLDPESLVPVVRKVVMGWTTDTRWTKDELIEDVLREAGLGDEARDVADRAIERALNRRIIVSDDDGYRAWCLSAEDFERWQYDRLLQALYHAVANGASERDEIYHRAAHWLGLQKAGDKAWEIFDRALAYLEKLGCIERWWGQFYALREPPPIPVPEDDLMCEIRALARDESPSGELVREDFLTALADRLGISWYSEEQELKLHHAIQTAAGRKIVEQDSNRCIHLLTKDITDYKDRYYDWLVERLVHRVPRGGIDDDELITTVARMLGFRTVRPRIRKVLKGAIMAAIRRNLLYRDEDSYLRRV